MRQLVGLSCVICDKKIGSIVDARFCTACGCPVHHKCARSTAGEPSGSGCSACGAKPEQAQTQQALDRRDEREGPRPGPEAPGLFASYQIVRFLIGGIACGFGGIVLLLWEFAEGPSFWAVVRAILISVLGFSLAGVLIWRLVRSG